MPIRRVVAGRDESLILERRRGECVHLITREDQEKYPFFPGQQVIVEADPVFEDPKGHFCIFHAKPVHVDERLRVVRHLGLGKIQVVWSVGQVFRDVLKARPGRLMRRVFDLSSDHCFTESEQTLFIREGEEQQALERLGISAA